MIEKLKKRIEQLNEEREKCIKMFNDTVAKSKELEVVLHRIEGAIQVLKEETTEENT